MAPKGSDSFTRYAGPYSEVEQRIRPVSMLPDPADELVADFEVWLGRMGDLVIAEPGPRVAVSTDELNAKAVWLVDATGGGESGG